MDQFRTVLAVVVVAGLIRHQASVVGNSHTTETGLSETVPTTAEATLEETTIQEWCPLSNLTVTPDFNTTYNYINLKLSWNEINNNNTVSISIIQQPHSKSDCLAEMSTIDHSLLNNSILQSDMVTSLGQAVNPGCSYTIYIFSQHGKGEQINCQFNYTLPDCVESKCDCDKYKPNPKILDLEPISGNKFKIKWDSGNTTTSGDFYEIREVRFDYVESIKEDFKSSRERAKIIENDLEKHVSEIQMKLFEGENYTLIGTFRNNFSCWAEYKRPFTAPMKSYSIISVIIFVLIGVVILVVILKFKDIMKYKTKVLNFIIPGRRRSQDLIALRSEQLPMTTNFQYTPAEISERVFDEYEFPRNRIIVKEVIGSGAFGQVYSAKAIGIGGIEGYKMVAVKTLGQGENTTQEAINDFIAEIEIFKKIGQHPNVVALLGCCTVDTPYMMIMEFVPCGDLKNYLLELRAQWLKRKNISMSRPIFFSDNSGSHLEPSSPTSSNSTKTSRLPSVSESVCPSPDVPDTPLLAHYANVLDKVLDHAELQKFALQIAKGMSHLEKIGVTHRDLAARNILINEHKILKISDFGLSRSGPYINHKTKKLPLRWMAIEAIVEQKYDSKSDVWSFGVVLWEIGTLGAFPYESVPDSFLQQFLQMGRRLERPEICTNELYELMGLCWARNPEDRPTFRELVDALDVKKRKVYVNFNQLNPTYIFPPSDIENFTENPVQIVDIHMQ
ncbi:receptor-like tyrosine-protein kinase kin-16 isoform X2 [Zophobas morio]|uniref:receptor-like tyrosine-protein kinase kin-16 isoform X2 n=1 Tax=Zophobas morio TaxID=2755281 RepID=UPI0030839D5A